MPTKIYKTQRHSTRFSYALKPKTKIQNSTHIFLCFLRNQTQLKLKSINITPDQKPQIATQPHNLKHDNPHHLQPQVRNPPPIQSMGLERKPLLFRPWIQIERVGFLAIGLERERALTFNQPAERKRELGKYELGQIFYWKLI